MLLSTGRPVLMLSGSHLVMVILLVGVCTLVVSHYTLTRSLRLSQHGAIVCTTFLLLHDIYRAKKTSSCSRRRVNSLLLAVSNTAAAEHARRERRDRQVLNTMWLKLFPFAVVFNAIALCNLATISPMSLHEELELPPETFLEDQSAW